MGIDVGICWKHWNRTAFAGARPQAHMLASFAPRNIRHPEHLGEKTRTPCLKNFSKFLKPGVQNINKHNFGGPNGIRTRVSVTTTFSPIHSVSCKAT